MGAASRCYVCGENVDPGRDCHKLGTIEHIHMAWEQSDDIHAKRIEELELQLRIWNNWANRFPLRSYSRCLFGFSSEAVTASNAKVIGQWLTSLWDIVRASIALVPDETPAAETKGEKS